MKNIEQEVNIKFIIIIIIIIIVAQCILKSTRFAHQQMQYLLTWLKVLNLH